MWLILEPRLATKEATEEVKKAGIPLWKQMESKRLIEQEKLMKAQRGDYEWCK